MLLVSPWTGLAHRPSWCHRRPGTTQGHPHRPCHLRAIPSTTPPVRFRRGLHQGDDQRKRWLSWLPGQFGGTSTGWRTLPLSIVPVHGPAHPKPLVRFVRAAPARPQPLRGDRRDLLHWPTPGRRLRPRHHSGRRHPRRLGGVQGLCLVGRMGSTAWPWSATVLGRSAVHRPCCGAHLGDEAAHPRRAVRAACMNRGAVCSDNQA
jgi:hypothetical protein